MARSIIAPFVDQISFFVFTFELLLRRTLRRTLRHLCITFAYSSQDCSGAICCRVTHSRNFSFLTPFMLLSFCCFNAFTLKHFNAFTLVRFKALSLDTGERSLQDSRCCWHRFESRQYLVAWLMSALGSCSYNKILPVTSSYYQFSCYLLLPMTRG